MSRQLAKDIEHLARSGCNTRKLAIEKILPLHGRVVPVADLYTTAKMTPK